jgi:NADH-quinone oxidoreductase subunit N
MAVATKVAAFGVLLRFFDVALISAQPDWGPALAILATVTIVIGNVGALTQTSLKRLLAWSSVAQAATCWPGSSSAPAPASRPPCSTSASTC